MTATGVLPTEAFAYRELQAVREIAHAFLVADRPEDVHQFALERVSPLLGASFSLVLMLDAAHAFMHPVAQYEWPEQYRTWIGALRIRIGHGPSGLAVAERRVVAVADLHADPMLSDWFEVATELGFRSIVAAPLIGAFGPLGAIAFYFADERHVTNEQHDLVRLIADQLAATTEKAQRVDELRRANAALAEANTALEVQAKLQDDTHREQLLFLDQFARNIVQLSMSAVAPEAALERVRALAQAAHETGAVERGAIAVAITDVDPRDPLLAAVAMWRVKARPLTITVGEPTVLLPTMRSDASVLLRALDLGLGYAVSAASATSIGIHAEVELGRGFVAYRLQWAAPQPLSGSGDVQAHNEQPFSVGKRPFDPLDALADALARCDNDSEGQNASPPSPLDLPLARALARLLGGDVRLIVEDVGELAIESLSLIFPLDAAPDTSAAMARLSLSAF